MKRHFLCYAAIIAISLGFVACSDEKEFANECEECIPDGVLKAALDGEYYMPSTCGNGVLDAGEVCDGEAGLDAYSCKAYFGDGSVGTISCSANCLSTTKSCSAPYSCGNGSRGLNEICETGDPWASKYGSYLACSMYGSSGTRRCTNKCRWDNSECVADATCGNGVLDDGEECDPNLPSSYNSFTCAGVLGGGSQGFVACTNLCTLSYANCTVPSTCGNGEKNTKETCDGVDEHVHYVLDENGKRVKNEDGSYKTYTDTVNNKGVTTVNGKTCGAMGKNYVGNLGCLPNCSGYDFSGCDDTTKPKYVCGNGIKEEGEECDGQDGLDSVSCKSLMGANSTGAVACTSKCKYNTSGCSIVGGDNCGDGIRQADEQCDYAIEYPAETLACGNNMIGEKYCATNCLWNRSHCKVKPECGNGIVEEGEDCEPGDPSSIRVNCEDMLGPGSRGEVTCTRYCKLSYSDCSKSACGDGIIQNGLNGTPNYHEKCDGDNVTLANGKRMNCKTLLGVGWTGTVKCNARCNGYDSSGCIPPEAD